MIFKWVADLIREGALSTDGRMLFKGATRWRDLDEPLPVLHEATIVGAVTLLTRCGSIIRACGIADLNVDSGATLYPTAMGDIELGMPYVNPPPDYLIARYLLRGVALTLTPPPWPNMVLEAWEIGT